MKNSHLWPSYFFERNTLKSINDIEKELNNGCFLGVFSFSTLMITESYLRLSYNISLVQLLLIDVKLKQLKNGPRIMETKIRFSKILHLVFVLQLAISLVFFIGASFFLENFQLKVFFLLLPVIIYFIGIFNFKYFKYSALKIIKEVGDFID